MPNAVKTSFNTNGHQQKDGFKDFHPWVSTFCDEDLRALAWAIEGLSKYIRSYEYPDAEDRIREMLVLHEAVTIAHAQKSGRLLELLEDLIAKMMVFRQQPIYVLMGFHGALLFEGDEFGFFEFDSPQMARDKIVEILDLTRQTGLPVNLEFELPSLKLLCQRYPELTGLLREAHADGLVELINSTYSHPYAHMIGPESNIRQFEYGGRLFEEFFGYHPGVYACSELALHTQTPQIARYFGIKNVSLRARLQGVTPAAPHPLIVWEGLDGTHVRALAQHSNNFAGEYYASIFYKEIFSLLIQARSGVPKHYAVFSSIVDHTVEMEDDVHEAYRSCRFGDIAGRHTTYGQLIGEGPEPCGVFRFPYDQFDIAYIPTQRASGLGHRIHAACRQLERRLLQTEKLIAGLMFNGWDCSPVLATLHAVWEALLFSENHDSFTVPYFRQGQYHRERMHINVDVFKPYLDPIPQDGATVGERTMDVLDKAAAELDKLADGLPVQGIPFTDQALSLNEPWPVSVKNGRLLFCCPQGLNLTLELLDEQMQVHELHVTDEPFAYHANAGFSVGVQFSSQGQIILAVHTAVDGMRLRWSGFEPGRELWLNLPMGAELTRKTQFVTTDGVWVRGAFVMFSDANYYYESDLERTRLNNYLFEQGDYRIVIQPGKQCELGWMGRQLADYLVPAIAQSAKLPTACVQSDSIHLQAMIPNAEGIALRLLNYSDQPAQAQVKLPAGWELGRQVDGYGQPRGEQPGQDGWVKLGPWTFGTFEVKRS